MLPLDLQLTRHRTWQIVFTVSFTSLLLLVRSGVLSWTLASFVLDTLSFGYVKSPRGQGPARAHRELASAAPGPLQSTWPAVSPVPRDPTLAGCVPCVPGRPRQFSGKPLFPRCIISTVWWTPVGLCGCPRQTFVHGVCPAFPSALPSASIPLCGCHSSDALVPHVRLASGSLACCCIALRS